MTKKTSGASTKGAQRDAQATTAKKKGVSEGKPPAYEAAEQESLVGRFDRVEALASEEDAITALRQLMFEQAKIQLEFGALLSKIKLMHWYGTECWERLNFEAKFEDFCGFEGINVEHAKCLMEIHRLVSATQLTWGNVDTLGWPKLRLIAEKALAAEAGPEEIDWVVSLPFDFGACPYIDLDEWLGDDFFVALSSEPAARFSRT